MTTRELIIKYPLLCVLCLVLTSICVLNLTASVVEEGIAKGTVERNVIQDLRDSLSRSEESLRRARVVAYELANGELYLESHSRRKGESFRYFRINALGNSIGYAIESNLPMDLEHLHKFDRWNQYMDSAKIPSSFWVPTLFRESSVGLNTKHKRNRDGSIDGGFSGINSGWGLPKNQQEEMRKFVEIYFLKRLDTLDYQTAEAVWMMGYERARKAGVIR